jgi:hypothetical protein
MFGIYEMRLCISVIHHVTPTERFDCSQKNSIRTGWAVSNTTTLNGSNSMSVITHSTILDSPFGGVSPVASRTEPE